VRGLMFTRTRGRFSIQLGLGRRLCAVLLSALMAAAGALDGFASPLSAGSMNPDFDDSMAVGSVGDSPDATVVSGEARDPIESLSPPPVPALLGNQSDGEPIGFANADPFTIAARNSIATTDVRPPVATDHAGPTIRSGTAIVAVDAVEQYRPTTLTFNPSVDHATNVISYLIELRRAGDPPTVAPVATRNLGKPAPVNGEISVDISSMVDVLPSGSYYGIIVAVGPTGVTASAPSPPFSTSYTSYTLTPITLSPPPGASFSVTWTAPSGSLTSDWVALYRLGDPNTSYLWWRYTGGRSSGTATLVAPSQAGTYEFRYLLSNGFTDVARSAAVTVGSEYTLTPSVTSLTPGAPFSVIWTAPDGRPPSDWIGLYIAGDPSFNYVWWLYTGGTTSSSVTLIAPLQPGMYEFRYLLDDGYTEAVRSATFTVTSD
jgi:hypothetical protein